MEGFSSIWDSLRVGDSVSKPVNSDILKVYRADSVFLFHLECDAYSNH